MPTWLLAVAVVVSVGCVLRLAAVSPSTKPEYDGRERRQRRAVDLGLVVGRDRQRRGGDGQAARDIADRVVAVDRAQAVIAYGLPETSL